MEAYIHKPAGYLSRFVKSIWHSDGYQPSGRAERVLPSGASQIIINLGHDSFRHFHNPDLGQAYEYEDVILTGMRTRPVFLDAHTRTSTIGIVLHEGAVPALFGIPAGEIYDEVVSLSELCRADMNALKQKLIEIPSPAAKTAALESFLERQLDYSFQLKPAIQFATDQIRNHHGMLSISDILNKTGYSRRWFAQQFREAVGITPKQYARLNRFQHIIGLLRQKESPHWADFALQCGYFDQAHFIHDFKDLSGISPSEYHQNYGEAANHLSV